MTVIIFIVVLAVLIFVHEIGHFLAAKLFGIRVDAFKIGFGPKIVSRKKGETEYGVNLIPFGGFVKIFGENPDTASMSGPDAKRSFVNKAKWQQAVVLVAGVFFNFLFAWLLYASVFVSGVTATTSGFERYVGDFTNNRIMITAVSPGSPSEKAGLQIGDVILNVKSTIGGGNDTERNWNDEKKSENGITIEDIQNAINRSTGAPVAIDYERGNLSQSVSVVPVRGIINDKYAIGIAMNDVGDLKLPIIDSIIEGCHYTLVMIRETTVGLYTFIANIFRGAADFSEVAGPIGIAGVVGSAAKMGLTYLVMITALISINLGVINLLPFPALDGGRVLFVAIESIFRRRIPAHFANIVNTVGFVALMILMVVVTYKDIYKLFGR